MRKYKKGLLVLVLCVSIIGVLWTLAVFHRVHAAPNENVMVLQNRVSRADPTESSTASMGSTNADLPSAARVTVVKSALGNTGPSDLMCPSGSIATGSGYSGDHSLAVKIDSPIVKGSVPTGWRLELDVANGSEGPFNATGYVICVALPR